MTGFIHITLVGIAAGVFGTAAGGACSLILRRPRDAMFGVLMALSGGIMLAVVFRELVPEAVQSGGLSAALPGIIVGLTGMAVLDALLPHEPSAFRGHGVHKVRLIRTSLLLGTGIAVHNIPEGLAIGAGYAAGSHLGLSMALILALHNVPEGLAMAGPLRGAGVRPAAILGWTAMAGVPMGIGAFIGALFGRISPGFLSGALGFAAGAMLYIVCVQLLPEAWRVNQKTAASATAVGVAMGLALIWAASWLPVA